jgi:hypothetical protein
MFLCVLAREKTVLGLSAREAAAASCLKSNKWKSVFGM